MREKRQPKGNCGQDNLFSREFCGLRSRMSLSQSALWSTAKKPATRGLPLTTGTSESAIAAPAPEENIRKRSKCSSCRLIMWQGLGGLPSGLSCCNSSWCSKRKLRRPLKYFSGGTVVAIGGIFALWANTGLATVLASFSVVWFVDEDEKMNLHDLKRESKR